MENKKGLSDIIATVLIVLLALAAVAIVWSFFQPTIRGAGEQIDVSQTCLEAQLKPLNCNLATNITTIQYISGDIDYVVAIADSGAGTKTVWQATPTNALESSSHDFDLNNAGGLRTGYRIKAAAVITVGGQNVTCTPTAEEITC